MATGVYLARKVLKKQGVVLLLFVEKLLECNRHGPQPLATQQRTALQRIDFSHDDVCKSLS
jgi:hypothetical protein